MPAAIYGPNWAIYSHLSLTTRWTRLICTEIADFLPASNMAPRLLSNTPLDITQAANYRAFRRYLPPRSGTASRFLRKQDAVEQRRTQCTWLRFMACSVNAEAVIVLKCGIRRSQSVRNPPFCSVMHATTTLEAPRRRRTVFNKIQGAHVGDSVWGLSVCLYIK